MSVNQELSSFTLIDLHLNFYFLTSSRQILLFLPIWGVLPFPPTPFSLFLAEFFLSYLSLLSSLSIRNKQIKRLGLSKTACFSE